MIIVVLFSFLDSDHVFYSSTQFSEYSIGVTDYHVFDQTDHRTEQWTLLGRGWTTARSSVGEDRSNWCVKSLFWRNLKVLLVCPYLDAKNSSFISTLNTHRKRFSPWSNSSVINSRFEPIVIHLSGRSIRCSISRRPTMGRTNEHWRWSGQKVKTFHTCCIRRWPWTMRKRLSMFSRSNSPASSDSEHPCYSFSFFYIPQKEMNKRMSFSAIILRSPSFSSPSLTHSLHRTNWRNIKIHSFLDIGRTNMHVRVIRLRGVCTSVCLSDVGFCQRPGNEWAAAADESPSSSEYFEWKHWQGAQLVDHLHGRSIEISFAAGLTLCVSRNEL